MSDNEDNDRSYRLAMNIMLEITTNGIEPEMIYGEDHNDGDSTFILAGGGPEVIMRCNHHFKKAWIRHRGWGQPWMDLDLTDDEQDALYEALVDAGFAD